MSYIIQPQNIDPTRVFDKGCYESRVRELSNLILEQLVSEDVKKFAKECRQSGEVVTPYPLNEIEIRAKFGETAKTEALRIVEEERRLCVAERADYIKNTLKIVIKRLRFLVFTDKGTKGKIIIEDNKSIRDIDGTGFHKGSLTYFETLDGGVERLQQIGGVTSKLSEFVDYLPYMTDDLLALYTEAQDLANLETVFLNAKTEKTEEPKTEA